MNKSNILLTVALFAMVRCASAQSQTLLDGKPVPAAQQNAQATLSNTYVIRHPGIMDLATTTQPKTRSSCPPRFQTSGQKRPQKVILFAKTVRHKLKKGD